jgi:hypothetical protein
MGCAVILGMTWLRNRIFVFDGISRQFSIQWKRKVPADHQFQSAFSERATENS